MKAKNNKENKENSKTKAKNHIKNKNQLNCCLKKYLTIFNKI